MGRPRRTQTEPTTLAQKRTADNNQFRDEQRKQALAEAKQAKANKNP